MSPKPELSSSLLFAFRPDRVISTVTQFVRDQLGAKFAEPPVLDLHETFEDSTSQTPLIFVLSPGVDPTENLRKLARELEMEDRLFVVALGQGQAPLATRLIEEGMLKGHWIFLANCHLMTSWLPALEELVKGKQSFDCQTPLSAWFRFRESKST